MDLSSLLNGLSEADLSRLRETAAAVFGGGREEQNVPAKPAAPALLPNVDLLASAAKLSSMFSQKDARAELLLALRPFLSESRRARADQAAQMLRLLAVVEALRRDRDA